MAFLDFIKHRNASKQPTVAQKSQERKPEHAREFFRGEAVREQAQLKPLAQMPEPYKAEAKFFGERIEREIQQLKERTVNAPADPASSSGTTSAQPMRQSMMQQDNASPSLTPTTAQAGIAATEQKAATQ
jgi:hypothetical protein